MPKAILELEMPVSCWECPLRREICCMGVFSHMQCGVRDESGLFKRIENPDNPFQENECQLKLADEHCRKAEWVNGKCKGFQVSRWNYDPIPKCKNCKDFEEHKEG